MVLSQAIVLQVGGVAAPHSIAEAVDKPSELAWLEELLQDGGQLFTCAGLTAKSVAELAEDMSGLAWLEGLLSSSSDVAKCGLAFSFMFKNFVQVLAAMWLENEGGPMLRHGCFLGFTQGYREGHDAAAQ